MINFLFPRHTIVLGDLHGKVVICSAKMGQSITQAKEVSGKYQTEEGKQGDSKNKVVLYS